MKSFNILIITILFSAAALSQELQWFGLRAGVGNLTSSAQSAMNDGIHSAFGWQVELPYSSDDLTEYGEAGLLFLGFML